MKRMILAKAKLEDSIFVAAHISNIFAAKHVIIARFIMFLKTARNNRTVPME